MPRMSSLACVLVHAFFLQLSVTLVRPTTSYIALDLGADAVTLAWVVASFSLLPIGLALWLGRVLDVGHEPQVLLGGVALMLGAGVGILFYSPNLAALCVWCAVLGLGHLMSLLSEQKRIASSRSTSQDRIFGLYTTAAAVAQLMGPLMLGVLGGPAVSPNITALLIGYMASVGALLVASVLMIFAIPVGNTLPAKRRKANLRQAFAVKPSVRKGLGASIMLSMMVLCAIDLLQIYLPALALERGISVAEVGLLLALRAAGSIISRFGLGWLVLTMGRTRILLLSTVLSGVLMALVVIPMPLPMGLVLMFVLGIMLGIGQPLSMAMISSHAPPHHQGSWLALRITGSRLGQVVVPIALSAAVLGMGAGGVLVGVAGLLGTASAFSVMPLRALERGRGER